MRLILAFIFASCTWSLQRHLHSRSPLSWAFMRSSSSRAFGTGLEEYICEPIEDLLRDVGDSPVREELLLTEARIQSLKNTYVGFRHGQSNANIAGIISSDFEIGVNGPHGLTATGEDQAKESVDDLFNACGKERFESGDVLFISSPFSRARQTAEVAAAEVAARIGNENTVEIEIVDGLRERYFGEFDQKALIYYNKVWPVDQRDAENSRYGVESVADVCRRVLTVVDDLENRFSSKFIVLTSHADTLQILNTLFSREDPRFFAAHRFKNCEVRDLIQPDLAQRRVPLTYQ